MYKLLKVEWLDSARPSPEWIHISDFTPQKPVQCISVGYLLFENDKVLAIAQNIGEIDCVVNAQASGIIHIPICSITKKDILC